MNVENASLVLRSFDLNTTEDNYGVVNSTNTVMTWKNIDLRTLLGTMYNNYDLFNLTLNSIATSKVKQAYNATASAGNGYAMGDAENLATMVQIAGLPFINQTYDMKTNVNKSTTLIGAFTFPSAINTSTSVNFYASNFATFGKSQDLANITISFIKCIDGTTPACSSTGSFPNTIYTFKIWGVTRDDSNKNSTRMLGH